MLRLLPVILMLLLMARAAVADDGHKNTEAEISSALPRMALVVSDVEVSKRFYTEGLGYRVGFDGDIMQPSVAAMLGLEEGQAAHPGGGRVRIGNGGSRPRRHPHPRRGAACAGR